MSWAMISELMQTHPCRPKQKSGVEKLTRSSLTGVQHRALLLIKKGVF